jgi:hypothetical protein
MIARPVYHPIFQRIKTVSSPHGGIRAVVDVPPEVLTGSPDGRERAEPEVVWEKNVFKNAWAMVRCRVSPSQITHHRADCPCLILFAFSFAVSRPHLWSCKFSPPLAHLRSFPDHLSYQGLTYLILTKALITLLSSIVIAVIFPISVALVLPLPGTLEMIRRFGRWQAAVAVEALQ